MEQAVSLVAPAPLPAAGGAAVAVALVADAMDYGRLRAVGLCGPADYGRYLREAERQLRGIDGQGVAVHLRVLEPVDYLDYCMVRGLRPGAPPHRWRMRPIRSWPASRSSMPVSGWRSCCPRWSTTTWPGCG